MPSSQTLATLVAALYLTLTVKAAPHFATYNSDPAALPTEAPYGPIPSQTASLYGLPEYQGYNPANPLKQSNAVIPEDDFQLDPNQKANPTIGLPLNLQGLKNAQPIRGSSSGPTDPGPQNMQYQALNPDLYAPPGSDSGSVAQASWPLGLSHNRHGTPYTAGWARQQNIDVLPGATAMAGVDMYLSPWAYRELHWHKANEWGYVLNGTVRVQASNDVGETFIDDLEVGDVWSFPAGIPHSIQAGENGTEFLLVFDDGSFSEDNTFLASETFIRNPREVLAKDLRTDVSAFDNLPTGELYIFPGTPFPSDISKDNVTGPNGPLGRTQQYSYHWSRQKAYEVPGGSVKIIDSTTFPIAPDFAAALVTIEPGAMREIHWHPTSDEWNFFIQGEARITIFQAPSSSQTFNYEAGSCGYISAPAAHYIENIGTEPVVLLEMLQTTKFTDISVGQWLGLLPPRIVNDTLHLPEQTIDRLPKVKPFILPGNRNLSTTNFTDTQL